MKYVTQLHGFVVAPLAHTAAIPVEDMLEREEKTIVWPIATCKRPGLMRFQTSKV